MKFRCPLSPLCVAGLLHGPHGGHLRPVRRGHGGRARQDRGQQVSCDWRRAGHVTTSSPLIGPQLPPHLLQVRGVQQEPGGRDLHHQPGPEAGLLPRVLHQVSTYQIESFNFDIDIDQYYTLWTSVPIYVEATCLIKFLNSKV